MAERSAVTAPTKSQTSRYLYTLDLDCPIAWPCKPAYLADYHCPSIIDNGRQTQDIASLYYDCLYKREPAQNSTQTVSQTNKNLADFAQLLRNQIGSSGVRDDIGALLLTSDQLNEKWHTHVPQTIKARFAMTDDVSARPIHITINQRELEELSHLFPDGRYTTQPRSESPIVNRADILDAPNSKQNRQTHSAQLADLEVAELKIQTLLTLEMLARTPLPEGGHLDVSQLSKTFLRRKRSVRDIAQTEGLRVSTVEKPRTLLAKQYWDMAKHLDQLTDTLAIHQAVGDLALSGLFLNRSQHHDANLEVSSFNDDYQFFWHDVCELHYTHALASDILSGCHSKFFSSATLHGSLFANSPNADGAMPVPPSPCHHPTPDLHALARSVQLAEQSRKSKMIPQSPTLAKLLGKSASSDKATVEGSENPANGPISHNDRLLLPDVPSSAPSRQSRFHLSIAGHNASKNPFRSREVEMRRTAMLPGRTQREAQTTFRRPFASTVAAPFNTGAIGQVTTKYHPSQSVLARRDKHKPPSPIKRIQTMGESRVLVQATPFRNARIYRASNTRASDQDDTEDDAITNAALRLLQPTPKAMRQRPAFMVLAGETPKAGRVAEVVDDHAELSNQHFQQYTVSSTPHRPEPSVFVQETPGVQSLGSRNVEARHSL